MREEDYRYIKAMYGMDIDEYVQQPAILHYFLRHNRDPWNGGIINPLKPIHRIKKHLL